MVVAVAVVRVMQVAADQVIDMVAMRHRLMPAARAVPMIGSMRVAIMPVAATGVAVVDGYPVLVDVVLVWMMQMAVVQVVDVVSVTHRHVAAVRTVAVRVIAVVRLFAVLHGDLLAVQGGRVAASRRPRRGYRAGS